jgi:hypothetical protein
VDEFEIVVTLLSFVYALGLTHLLQFLSDLVIARRRVRLSFVHLMWTVLAFGLLVNNWLALMPLRETELSGELVAVMFGFAVVQYFCCSLVSPRVPDEGPVDLAAYEESHGRYYRIPFLALCGLALLNNYMAIDEYFPGVNSSGEILVSQSPTIIGAVLTAVSIWRRERWLQIVIAGVSMVILVSLLL